MANPRVLLISTVLVAACASMPALASSNDYFRNGQSLYGEPGVTKGSPQTVQLPNNKRTVLAVAYGESVTFKAADGREFSWTFNGLDRRSVSLSKIAPPGFPVVEGSRVSVGPNLMFRN